MRNDIRFIGQPLRSLVGQPGYLMMLVLSLVLGLGLWQASAGIQASAAQPAPLSGRLAAGYFHHCAIVAGGQVKCWGLGQQGQLGNGRYASSAAPQTVRGLEGVVELIAGYHWTCARLGDGSLRCWGATAGRYAPQADRKKVRKCRATASIVYDCVAEPIAVSGVSKIKALGASGNFLYAIRANGQVVAVDMDYHEGTPTLQTLDWLSGIEQVDGYRATGNTTGGCARDSAGRAFCWSSLALAGDYLPNCAVKQSVCSIAFAGEQIGLTGEEAPGFCKAQAAQEPLELLEPMRWSCKPSGKDQECTYVKSTLADSTHFQAVFIQGSSVKAFYPERVITDPQHPSNCEQPLSDEIDRRPIVGVEQLSSLSLNGGEGVYALRRDGAAFFWGIDTSVAGFLPKLTARPGPMPRAGLGLTPVPQLKGAIQIEEGSFMGCALWPSGEVRCWGDQRSLGMVGNGQAEGFVSAPVRLALPPVLALSQGDYHFCVLARDGRVLCWGSNEAGVLGPAAKGPFAARPVAIPVLKVRL